MGWLIGIVVAFVVGVFFIVRKINKEYNEALEEIEKLRKAYWDSLTPYQQQFVTEAKGKLPEEVIVALAQRIYDLEQKNV